MHRDIFTDDYDPAAVRAAGMVPIFLALGDDPPCEIGAVGDMRELADFLARAAEEVRGLVLTMDACGELAPPNEFGLPPNLD